MQMIAKLLPTSVIVQKVSKTHEKSNGQLPLLSVYYTIVKYKQLSYVGLL